MKHGGRMNPGKRPEPAIRWRGKRFTIPEACGLAIQQNRLGQLAEVAEIYGLILAQVPDYAEGHNNRGVVLQVLGRLAEALVCYDRALALKPDYTNALFNRGIVLKKLGWLDEALASYDRALAVNPNHAEACNNRGVLLQDLRRCDEALAGYDRAIALKPDYAEAHNNRGIVLMSLGDLPEAEKAFTRATELRADFADPLFNLAIIRQHQAADDAEAKRVRALLDKPGLVPGDREQLLFTLGKIYDDSGRYDEAFECFRQANELRNAGVKYDATAVERLTDSIIEVFSKEFLAQPFAFSSESGTPLFIVGMPRSGTTLLASMLSNHPAIATAGELSTLGDLASQLGQGRGGVGYPAAVREMTAAEANRITAEYEKRLRRDAGSEKRHVIDKNPLNFRLAGLIARLFPQARIIHCTRNALDTCVSNYFQRFPLFLDYAFDLRNIGHFYGQYERLMEHWRGVPGLRMMEVRYEDAILRTEPTARAMLDFLGLEWDARCVAPHTNTSPVETASQWQVRQPIYQRAIERWRHYEKHLGEVKRMLGTFNIQHSTPNIQ